MESKTYLLVFSILLTYYSYLCDICKENKGQNFGNIVGYDDEGIYACSSDNGEEGGDCRRSSVEGNISSCESAFDEIKNKFQFKFIFDSGSCEKINNKCYYD